MTAVINARYSSDNQREESIEGQLRECKAFAEKNDIQIVGTYIDRAFSARTDNRPDFQKMIKDSASKKFELIIVWKLDRFARDRYDSAHYKAALRKPKMNICLPQNCVAVNAIALWLARAEQARPQLYIVITNALVLKSIAVVIRKP